MLNGVTDHIYSMFKSVYKWFMWKFSGGSHWHKNSLSWEIITAGWLNYVGCHSLANIVQP